MSKFTEYEQRFIDGIRKAVADKGEDYVYPNELREDGDPEGACRYTVDGKGACIVGVAIENAVGTPYPENNRNFMAATVLRGDYGLLWDLAGAFGVAQVMQDGGTPWGHALVAFEEELKRVEEAR